MSRNLGPNDVNDQTQVAIYLNYQADPSPWVMGEVIAYNDQPMVCIRQLDGSQKWVNCSLRWEPLSAVLPDGESA